MTTYREVGGLDVFRRLAASFYARVRTDRVLNRVFPEITDEHVERLALFLAETFGGPKRFTKLPLGQRNLRQMHAAFAIGERERKAWKKQMNAALDDVGIEGPARRVLHGFFCDGLRRLGEDDRYDVPLTELTRLLAKDPQIADARGRVGNLLHDAALAWDVDRVRLLLQSGANVNARSFDGGHSPLYYAANRVDRTRVDEGRAVAELLVQHGANVNLHSGPTRGTPLHTAARRGNVEIGEVLLAAGAEIDARDAKGETPLRRALNCRQFGTAEWLVARGASLDAADKRGVTPRQVALTRGVRIQGT